MKTCHILISILLITRMLNGFNITTCGVEKGCVSQPEGCDPLSLASCQVAFSYQIDGDYMIMELFGAASTEAAYVAVGFSDDRLMGNDSVTECSQAEGQPLQGRLSYNLLRENRRINVPENVLNEQLQTMIAKYKNGRLYCVLRQKIIPSESFKTDQVRPLSGKYFILLTTGQAFPQGILMHSVVAGNTYPYVSNNVQDLQQFRSRRQSIGNDTGALASFGFNSGQNPESFSVVNSQGETISSWNLRDLSSGAIPMAQGPLIMRGQLSFIDFTNNSRLKKAHGILMCIAWMVFISTGIMLSRYSRDHWPETKLCGLMLWFHFHRTLNILGIALTIASFACVFAASDWRWTGPKAYQSAELNQSWGSVHSMLGLLACVIAWAQPLNAVFRCHPESSFRFIFNFIHRFFGLAAWLMAAASTMIATKWFKGRFTNSDAAMGLFIAFIAVFGVSMIINEIMLVRKWWMRRSTVVSADMEMMPVSGKQRSIVSPELEKMNRMQLLSTTFFLFAAVGTCIAMCCLQGLVSN